MQRSFRKRSRRIGRDEAFIFDVITLLLIFPIILRYLPIDFLLSFEWLSGNQLIRFALAIALVIVAVVDRKRGRQRASTMAIVPVLIVIIEAFWYLPIAHFNQTVPEERKLRIVTMNTATASLTGLVDRIATENADVFCLQEVYVEHLDKLFSQARERGYDGRFAMLRDDAGMGTAIFSRYPILSTDTLVTSSWKEMERQFIAVQIDVNGQRVRVISVQLESTKRNEQLWGVIESWKLRLQQARLIQEAVEGTFHPVIVAGDLNATPTNRALKPLKSILIDSWRVAGIGLGGTWPRQFPLLRLDAVLYHGFTGAVNAARFKAAFSDHLAYRVDLILPE
ncbi:MAG: endonuclease/exonuclease/phosphatase family protein [bacterium]